MILGSELYSKEQEPENRFRSGAEASGLKVGVSYHSSGVKVCGPLAQLVRAFL